MSDWHSFFQEHQPQLEAISDVIQTEDYYPDPNKVYRAFELTPYEDVKVVIVGQDPYSTTDRKTKEPLAQGLAFSVKEGMTIPPSLRNIFRALEHDISGYTRPKSGNLTSWAQQGVLLLNMALTVRAGQPGSHDKLWRPFIKEVVHYLGHKPNVIYLLWGSKAQQVEKWLGKNAIVLKASHPVGWVEVNSDFAGVNTEAGTVGGVEQTINHFSETNRLLKEIGEQPIRWQT